MHRVERPGESEDLVNRASVELNRGKLQAEGHSGENLSEHGGYLPERVGWRVSTADTTTGPRRL